MTIHEFENHPEYRKCMDKIGNYRPGFQFTMDYTIIPTLAKQNGMRRILRDACKLGLLECIATDINLYCEITAETFKRTEVEYNV